MANTAELTEQAHAKYRKGDYLEALEIYHQALQVAALPSHLIALHSNRAACFLKLRDFPKTVEECSAVLQHDPNHVGILLLRAQTLQMMEDFQSSLFDVNRLLQIQPKHSSYLKMKARLKTQISKRAPPPILESDSEPTSEPTSEPASEPASEPISEPDSEPPSIDQATSGEEKPINNMKEILSYNIKPSPSPAPTPTLTPSSSSSPKPKPTFDPIAEESDQDEIKSVSLNENIPAEKMKTVFKNEVYNESIKNTQSAYSDFPNQNEIIDHGYLKNGESGSSVSLTGDVSSSFNDGHSESNMESLNGESSINGVEERRVEMDVDSEKVKQSSQVKPSSHSHRKHAKSSKNSPVLKLNADERGEGDGKNDAKLKTVRKIETETGTGTGTGTGTEEKKHTMGHKGTGAKSTKSKKSTKGAKSTECGGKSNRVSEESMDKALVIVKKEDHYALDQIKSNQVRSSRLDYSKWDRLYVSSDEEEETMQAKTLYKIKPI